MIIKNSNEYELIGAYKAASSFDKKYYQKPKKTKNQNNFDFGPAAIITVSGHSKEEYFIYDRFGRKKKF